MVTAVVRIMRPTQWLKNAVVLAPLVFSQKFTNVQLSIRAITALLGFCALSSAVYVVNDIVDIERDRNHPVKCRRPLPSGELSIGVAGLLALVCAATGSVLCACLGYETFAVGLAYALLVSSYSLIFKKMVVLDVMVLATGFVLRAVAGATAIQVEVSPWLAVCTVLLAMFIALGKRRHELLLLDDDAASHRVSLREYTPHLLDQMIAIVSASTIMAYSLYTMSKDLKDALCPMRDQYLGGVINRRHLMALTIPYVLYGIFRYLYLIHRRDFGGSPEKALFLDLPLLTCVILWLLTAAAVFWVS